jgi:hypothetical protein
MAWEEDPIVEEVRKTREKLLDEYGGIEKLLEYIKKREREDAEQLCVKEQPDTKYGSTPDEI